MIEWMEADNDEARPSGWIMAIDGRKIWAFPIQLGDNKLDRVAAEHVAQRAEEGDPLCCKALAYIAQRRLLE